jgi:uncharacterized protein YecT (DUF1311 family)
MPLASLALLLAVLHPQETSAQAPGLRDRAWIGGWKTIDPANTIQLWIEAVGPAGIAFSLNEGIGRLSHHERGLAAWTAHDRARLAGERCEMELTLREDARFGLRIDAFVGGDLCFTRSHTRFAFVRDETRLDHFTSFDCTRAKRSEERAVCADPHLATADRRLDRAYAAVLARAGARAGEVQRAQRNWLTSRRRECAAGSAQDDCLMRAFGRRLLELRAWPDRAFGRNGRPDVGVIGRVLRTGPDAVEESGVRELIAGTVGGAPADLWLKVYPERRGVTVSGWYLAPQQPQSYAVYLTFQDDGSTWASWWEATMESQGERGRVVPQPKRGQRLPESLEEFRDAGPPDDATALYADERRRRMHQWAGHWTSTDAASGATIDIEGPFDGGFSMAWHDGMSGAGSRVEVYWSGDQTAVFSPTYQGVQCAIALIGGQLQAVFPSDACFGSGDHWRRPFVRKETRRE